MDNESNTAQGEFQTGGVATVSLAHAVHDTYTGFLPALLPVLIQRLSLTNTAAGLLSVFIRLPSLFQPLIGHLADHANLRLVTILAPTITGAAMSFLGLAPTYSFLIFLLVIAGASSALLHATGPIMGSNFSGDKLGKGMSFWMVGGEMGRTIGPLVTVSFITYFSVEAMPWLMLAGMFTSVFLYTRLNTVSTQVPETGEQLQMRSALKAMRKVFLPLIAIIFAQSMMTGILNTFLPTFMVDEGASLSMAGMSSSILYLSGTVGAFLAGGLSDKLGRRKMLVISFIATPIAMFLFVQAKNLLQIPFLVLMGFFGLSITPVIMAIIIENYPDQRSFANGLYMMLSFILQSLAVLLIGFLSDIVSLRFAFYICTAVLPTGLLFISLLPKPQYHPAEL